MDKGRGLAIWVGAFCAVVLLGVFCAYFGRQIHTYLKLRETLVRVPAFPRGLDVVPRPLVNTDVSGAQGETLTDYGYQFDVPWKGLLKTNNPLEDDWVQFDLGGGVTIEFSSPDYFKQEPGDDKSKYNQYRDTISIKRSELWPFCSHATFTRDMALLNRKGAWLEHNPVPADIFSFQTPQYKGFEISGLSRGWEFVTLNLFDSDNHRFEMMISVDRRYETKLSQPEINRIIQSFGPAGRGGSIRQ
jgi:hypothetical protein